MILADIPAQVKVDWILLWTRMGWLDVIFLISLAFGIFLGFRNGLAKAFPRLMEVVVAQAVALEYSKVLSQFLQVRFQIPIEMLQIVIFAVLAVASIMLVGFLFRMLTLVASVEFKPPLNNIGGAIFGGFRFIFLLGLISTFLMLFPIPFIQETFTQHSISGPFLVQSGERIHGFFAQWLPTTWQAK